MNKKTQQEQLLQRLEMRMGRLRRLLKLDAPKRIVGNEIVLILQVLIPFAPEAVGTAFFEWIDERLRVSRGLCPGAHCNGEGEVGVERSYLPLCEKCQAEEDADAADDDEEPEP